MTAQHTPGPWGVIIGDAGPIVFSGNKGGMVAQLVKQISSAERLANAILIAAAPDLLAALKEADEDFAREGFDKDGPYRAHIIAAIAKATGGAA